MQITAATICLKGKTSSPRAFFRGAIAHAASVNGTSSRSEHNGDRKTILARKRRALPRKIRHDNRETLLPDVADDVNEMKFLMKISHL